MPDVVIVVSGCASLPRSARHTGVSMDQLGRVHESFTRVGWHTVVVSPSGGAAPIDAGTLSEEWALARGLAAETIAIDQLPLDAGDAWFVLGGHGALHDLIGLRGLTERLTAAAMLGRTVAAVDHGSAVLAASAAWLARHRSRPYRLTGRSDLEERQVRHLNLIRRSTEQVIRRSGLQFVAGAPWQPHVVVDAPFVTGQNPASAAIAVAEVLTRHLTMVTE
jgi:putative intracellular protease/amidase